MMLEGIPVSLPSLEVYSLAAGGGSIARPSGKGVKVGPESAGAMPAACYGLGARRPRQRTPAWSSATSTRLLPRRQEEAGGGPRREVIEQNVASPLGISAEAASQLITEGMEDISAEFMSKLIKDAGTQPKTSSCSPSAAPAVPTAAASPIKWHSQNLRLPLQFGVLRFWIFLRRRAPHL